jgi:hypothetical protein
MDNDGKLSIFKECFASLSIRELNDRINFYRTLNFKAISEERLKQEIRKLCTVNFRGEDVSFFMNKDTYTRQFERFHFYRVRKFTEGDYDALTNFNFPSLQSVSDIWAKPAELVNTPGRLNRVHNSVFYAAKEAANAVYETLCEPGDLFFLLVYSNKKQMRLTQIHDVPYLDELTEEENAKRLLLHNFLLTEFTKTVPPGWEHLYRSSILIYEEYFKGPKMDALCYPSTRTDINTGFNIAFEDRLAKENLNFLGLMVCQLLPPGEGSNLRLNIVYDGFFENEAFTFYPVNSTTSRAKFGDFVMLRDIGVLC